MNGAPSIRLIVSVVSATFEVPVLDILSQRRSAGISVARHAAYWLCRELTYCSIPTIARHLGNRDHTTVMAGIETARAMLRTSESFRDLVETARSAIGAIAASRFADAFHEPDAVAAAQTVLRDPRVAAHKATPEQMRALAVHLLALDEIATLTVQLLSQIDELQLTEPPLDRRLDLARASRFTLANLNRAFADIGRAQQETSHGQVQHESEDHRDAAAGTAVA